MVEASIPDLVRNIEQILAAFRVLLPGGVLFGDDLQASVSVVVVKRRFSLIVLQSGISTVLH